MNGERFETAAIIATAVAALLLGALLVPAVQPIAAM
jgi:hypothetical protein